MKPIVLAFAVFAFTASSAAAAVTHFAVTAAFEPPAKAGTNGAVAVTFSPTDPDVHINEQPEPRLELDPAQTVLADKQPPPAKGVTVDFESSTPLDLAKPVRFPVALRAGAPKGEQTLTGSVVYFYCSTRERWCRRGKASVEFSVRVP